MGLSRWIDIALVHRQSLVLIETVLQSDLRVKEVPEKGLSAEEKKIAFREILASPSTETPPTPTETGASPLDRLAWSALSHEQGVGGPGDTPWLFWFFFGRFA
jgi:hypothetical protein